MVRGRRLHAAGNGSSCRSHHTKTGLSRGTSSVVGVVLLTGITVLAAATVGFAVSTETPTPPPTATFDIAADAEADRIILTHERGETVNTTALTLQVEIDGQRLSKQPPIPFFAAEGFESGPTGPFNTAGSTEWRSGETARLTIATTNEPQIEPGRTVTVTLLTENVRIAKLETEA